MSWKATIVSAQRVSGKVRIVYEFSRDGETLREIAETSSVQSMAWVQNRGVARAAELDGLDDFAASVVLGSCAFVSPPPAPDPAPEVVAKGAFSLKAARWRQYQAAVAIGLCEPDAPEIATLRADLARTFDTSMLSLLAR